MRDSSQSSALADLGRERSPAPPTTLRERLPKWLQGLWSPPAQAWQLAPDDRRSRLVCRALALLVFTGFVSYFGLVCFRQRWSGDFQLYCAAVTRVYEDALQPSHEAVMAPASESFAYSPYLVLLALVGKLLGVSPYRALQLAGCANLVLFCASAAYLFARHSLHRRWELAATCFLFVTLFVRWKYFDWSSETSVVALGWVQAYPSTIAWVLAFFALGLLKGGVERGRLGSLAAIAGVVALLLLTHGLTASWVVGISGLYGFVSSVRQRSARPLLQLLAALAVGFGLALLWPYSPLLGQSSLLAAKEGAPFGASPFIDFPNLYYLALPCAAYLVLRLRRHGFWLLGMVVTLGVLMLWRRLGIDYGNRYAFFGAFFAQFLLAEVMALGLLGLSRPLCELSAARRWPWLDRPLTLAVALGALSVWQPSPMWKEHGKAVRPPWALLRAPSAHDVYYARFGALKPLLTGDDVVLAQSSDGLVFELAAITHAHFVSAPYMVRVPDQGQREADVQNSSIRKAPQIGVRRSRCGAGRPRSCS